MISTAALSGGNCRTPLPPRPSRAEQVPAVAGDVFEHRELAVRLDAWCRNELHAVRPPPVEGGVEVVDAQRERDATGRLLADYRRVVLVDDEGHEFDVHGYARPRNALSAASAVG